MAQAAVLNVCSRARATLGDSLVAAMNNGPARKRLVREVAEVVRIMRLWKLQTVGREHLDFLYAKAAVSVLPVVSATPNVLALITVRVARREGTPSRIKRLLVPGPPPFPWLAFLLLAEPFRVVEWHWAVPVASDSSTSTERLLESDCRVRQWRGPGFE